MQLPIEFSTIWSTIVSCERPCKVTIPDGASLTITNLCVGREDFTPETGRLVLYAKVNGGEEIAIAPFILGSFESTTVELDFVEGDEIIFTIKGAKASVHVAGYLGGQLAINVEGAREPLVQNEVKEEPKEEAKEEGK